MVSCFMKFISFDSSWWGITTQPAFFSSTTTNLCYTSSYQSQRIASVEKSNYDSSSSSLSLSYTQTRAHAHTHTHTCLKRRHQMSS